MTTETIIKFSHCDGDGKIKVEGCDLSVSTTAWTSYTKPCPYCLGKGVLTEIVEQHRRVVNHLGQAVEMG